MRGHNFINMSLANCGPHFCFASQNSSRTVRCQLTRQESLKNWGNRVFISSLKLPTYIQRRITFPTYELNSYSKFLLMNSLKAALFPISVISDLKLGQARRRCPQNVCRLKQQAAIYNLLFARFWYGNNVAL